MALLIKLKPFEEEPEDAAKWSSINKLAYRRAQRDFLKII
eukprot:SAG31_NODE_5486_length_2512_cov_1.878989_1_plen_39_part_10